MQNLLAEFLRKEKSIAKWFNLETFWDYENPDPNPQRVRKIAKGLLEIQAIADNEISMVDFTLESKYLEDVECITDFDFANAMANLYPLGFPIRSIPRTISDYKEFRLEVIKFLADLKPRSKYVTY